MTQFYALRDQRDVILTDDAVLDGGRELTGDEIGVLAAQLDRARHETLWREVNRTYPLGTWILGPDQLHGMVIDHHRGASGAEGHRLLVLTQGQIEHMVPVADVRPATPPQGAS